MSNNKQTTHKHHYIPVFYLKKWTGDNGKLKQYSIPNSNSKKVKELTVYPSGTGFEVDLYSRKNLPSQFRDYLETHFLQIIDDDAARFMEKMIKYGIPNSDQEMCDWARFIFSITHRAPERIKNISIKYEEHMEFIKKTIHEHTELTESVKAVTLEGLPQKIDQSLNGLIEKLHNPQKSGTYLINQAWGVIEFSEDALITSDHPIVSGKYDNDLDFRGGVFLAISPRHLFLSSDYVDFIKQIEHRKEYFAKRYNKIVCMKSAKYVFSSQSFSNHQNNVNFIFKNFGKIPPENFGLYDDCRDIVLKPNKDLFLKLQNTKPTTV